MTQLTRSWLVMAALAFLVAALLLFAPPLPRLGWLAMILGAAFIKSRLILLDYLELRAAQSWRQAAVASLTVLLLLMAVLSMP